MKKQSDGRYRSKIVVGHDENNIAITKYISARSKAEFEKKKAAYKRQAENGMFEVDDSVFSVYAKTWLTEYKKPRLSPSSIDNYSIALDKDILPVFGKRMIRSIRTTDIQAFINSFEGYSATKIRTILAVFRGVFKLACANGLIDQNPAAYVFIPTASKPAEKRALTTAERKRIEKVFTADNGEFMACLYYLGCRQGEARGLQWGDFDWKKNTVHIQRDIDNHNKSQVGALKTESSNRYVPVPKPLRDILYPKRKEPDEFVFCGKNKKPWGKSVTERTWCKLCLLAGFATKPDGKYRASDPRSVCKPTITPHILRHNYISMCYENGFDVFTTMRLVGHKNYKTTMDIYTHLGKDKLKKVGKDVELMFDKKNKTE